jgi:Ser/Thr protein kinase RdoA (MazF antagonist)
LGAVANDLAAIVQRANINERVNRLLTAIPKLEGDNKDMEEDNIHVDMEEDNIHVDMEEDNIDMEEALTYRKRPYRCVKRIFAFFLLNFLS